MTDAAVIERERHEVFAMFTLIATARQLEAIEAQDERLMASALNIRHLAETVGTVGDAMVTKLSTVNGLSEGRLATIIAERAAQIGLELPLYDDASAFFKPIETMIDLILQDARQHLH
jgi:hypothetical protein